jgi:hypothetical protein
MVTPVSENVREICVVKTKTILLLTATINPPSDATNLARTNPLVRLEDYKRALNFYITHLSATFDHIVFVDNSLSDLTELANIVRAKQCEKNVELINFSGLDYPAIKGRGYGELRLIDYAMNNSRFIASDPNAQIWKCTGRYMVRNIKSLVESTPNNADLYCHYRNWPLKLCELSVISWSLQGYRTYIANSAENVRNDIVPGVHTFEEVLFRQHLERNTNAKSSIHRRFKSTPIIDGNRGWDNSNYSRRFSPKIIFRQMSSVVAPWLWV